MTRRLAPYALAALMLMPASAHAYVDPGSGGIALQVILGAIVGISVTLKLYWRRLTGLFRRRKDDDEV